MMKTHFTFILLVFGLCISAASLQAQTKTTASKMTFYYELWGNGLTSSFNMDMLFRIDHDLVIVPRLGLGVKDNFLGRGYDIVSFPMELTAMVDMYKTRHFLEVGPGLTITNFSNVKGDANIGYMTLRAGYRYQPENGWFVFRAGIIPMLDFYSGDMDYQRPNYTWDIMAGISLGIAL
ncbi:hypothetical protein [Saccharicrinis sp. FJH54]|uniref:hypothetical protein n=1 Tax=Saccharicrinis sp. FJH54 TaxID=3344665 RepID=UPI0035D486FA